MAKKPAPKKKVEVKDLKTTKDVKGGTVRKFRFS
jgi:hypothetical protein